MRWPRFVATLERPPFGVVIGAVLVIIFVIAVLSLASIAPEVGATVLVLALLLEGLLFIVLSRQQQWREQQESLKEQLEHGKNWSKLRRF
jgi:uncharacterized RDD family membrane protein YckC